MEIPKDLKPLYDLAKEADQGEWCPSWTYSAIRHVVRNCDIECGEHPDNSCPSFGRYDGTFIAAANASRVIQLIERIASLEAALREKEQIEDEGLEARQKESERWEAYQDGLEAKITSLDQELAQARAEIERMKSPLPKKPALPR